MHSTEGTRQRAGREKRTGSAELEFGRGRDAQGLANRAGTVLSHGWRRRAHTDVFTACPGPIGQTLCHHPTVNPAGPSSHRTFKHSSQASQYSEHAPPPDTVLQQAWPVRTPVTR